MQILLSALIFSTDIYIAMISINTYDTTCKLKWIQVFASFIRDLKYQALKKTKLETDLKNVISEKYHNILDVFSKKTLIHFFPIQNIIIKSYYRNNSGSMIISYHIKCHLKNFI